MAHLVYKHSLYVPFGTIVSALVSETYHKQKEAGVLTNSGLSFELTGMGLGTYELAKDRL